MTTPPDPAETLQFTISAALATRMQAAIEIYGEPVVQWAWDAFMPPFLPFAKEIMKEQHLLATAKNMGLDLQQAEDAIRLLSNLRGAEDPHKAWLAAEVVLRSVPADRMQQFRTALNQPQGEKAN